jgi:hypothetical protein
MLKFARSWPLSTLVAVTAIACAGRSPEPAASAPSPVAAPARTTVATPAPVAAEVAAPAAVADEDRQIAVLREARASFAEFIDRAGNDPEFAEAVQRSRDRIEDIDATIVFLEQSKVARLGEAQP